VPEGVGAVVPEGVGAVVPEGVVAVVPDGEDVVVWLCAATPITDMPNASANAPDMVLSFISPSC